MRLLVDMDGVITDFNKLCWDKFEDEFSYDKYPRPEKLVEFYAEDTYDDPWFVNKMQGINQEPGFFLELEPMAGAIDALKDLASDDKYEVFLCTAPLLENATCCNDKLEWVHQHLGGDWVRRTIITKDKTVIDGDFLIDDKPIITGITDDPIWQRLIFDQPYNKNIVGRRINWKNYKEVLNSIW